MKDTALIIVHPWDLGPLEEKWTFRGIGHNDIKYEHHIHEVVRPFIKYKMSEQWIGVSLPPARDGFRIHPAINRLQDFVLYDDEDVINRQALKELGVTKLRVGGYGWDLCVKDFYRRYWQFFDTKINPVICLPTVKNKWLFYEAITRVSTALPILDIMEMFV